MSEIGTMLARWMNIARGAVSPARERVCVLLTALHSLEQTLREHPIVDVPEHGPTVPMSTSPGVLLRDAINKQLADYQFKPTLLVTDPHKTPIQWLPPDSNDSKEIEATMVRLVCDLHNEGTLSQLRECLCGKWFMARSDKQECCSTRCRQKKWGKTDKGKQKGKQASKASYDRGLREPKLKAIKVAVKEWSALSETFRQQHDWRDWVARRATVTNSFLTRAVNKGEVAAPPK